MQIEIKEKVDTGIWYRQISLTELFVGLSLATIKKYTTEMENLPQFQKGVLKPGHSITLVNYDTFLKFLVWKEENKYRR
ncbi:hypothetical protein B9P78_00380 [Aerococcus sp. 1KP-2016]|nr:hypothetical protein B9P78_00380 [Aerococcus sp. 1KP-2016]